MKLVEWLCKTVTSALSTFSLTVNPFSPDQHVLTGSTPGLTHPVTTASPSHDVSVVRPDDDIQVLPPNVGKGPVYSPPSGAYWDDFQCDYSAMGSYWKPCSTPEDRSCWLRNNVTKEEYNIHTDYDAEFSAPKGILRKYSLAVTDGQINADGMRFTEGKFFNGTYNGPWIQACWGDTLEITVTNYLSYNGTSVHWHGIRQLRSMQMDGVNGVTQCAIAPGDSYTYRFHVTQYGSSWYHSHYSLQYADGATGQLTLHGPTSAPYDEAKFPLIMTDWSHDSAFNWAYSLQPLYLSILLNGKGNVTRYNGTKADLAIPEPYSLNFTFEGDTGLGRPKRYLLRLINTSYQSMFVFSIDNHYLTIVGSDFVPIHPYSNTSVLIAIGQRYHVIVEAKPTAGKGGSTPPRDGNFWIRTWVAGKDGSGCGKPGIHGYEKTGILRYNTSSTSEPTSHAWQDVSLACSDETYSSLRPVVPWKVKHPANRSPSGSDFGQLFDLTASHGTPKGKPDGYNLTFPLSFFALGANPLRIDYGDPTFIHLSELHRKWSPSWVVVPEDFKSDDWVWMVIQGPNNKFAEAHPVSNATFTGDISKFKLDNPPRRDVALLPSSGYIAIAFKTDNPGSWILERQSDASRLWEPGTPTQEEAARLCKNWNAWQKDTAHWWNATISTPYVFQDDSGI